MADGSEGPGKYPQTYSEVGVMVGVGVTVFVGVGVNVRLGMGV